MGLNNTRTIVYMGALALSKRKHESILEQ